MAALTWREMSAPDLSTSIRGVGQFNDILQQTLANARGTVNEIDAGMSDRTNNAALRIAAGAADADAAKALLSDPALMGNTRLTAPTISALAARPGQLTNQALGETNLEANKLALDITRYTDGRTRGDNTKRDAAAPAIAALAAAAATGDPAKIAAAQAQYGTAASAVPYSDLLGNLKSVQGLESGAVGIQGGRLGNVRTGVGIDNDRIQGQTAQFQLQTARETYNDNKVVDGLIGSLGLNAMDADTARSTIQGMAGRLTPSQLGMAMGKVNGLFPGTFGASEIPDIGGNGVGASGAATVTVGGGQLPGNIQTVGDVLDNRSQLIKNGNGHSNMGLYQIGVDTWKQFAPAALGSNYRSANVRDPAVQDRVAEAIWNSARGSAKGIHGRWDSVPESQARALVGKPWSAVRDIISQGESSSSASRVLGTAAAALSDRPSAGRNTQRGQSQVQARNSQFEAQGISTSKIIASYTDTNSDTADVVDKLYAGRFKGTSKEFLERQINDIATKARVSPATAGAILESSITNQKPKLFGSESLGRFARQVSGGTPDLGDGKRIDDNRLRDLTEAARTGGFEQKVDGAQTLQGVYQNLQAAQLNAQRASSRLQAAVNRGLPPAQIARLTQQQQLAEGQLLALQKRIKPGGGLGPTRDYAQ